jgi:hypothetical protein
MKVFTKTNVILAAVMLGISCIITFAQTDQKNAQKNQPEVFDANNATLEEAQKWLQKTLVKYGRYTASFPNVTFRGRVENVKFKGCEIFYERSLLTEHSSETLNTTVSSSSVKANMAATDFRSLFSRYSEVVSRTKINLTNLDADKTIIVEKGNVVWVQVFSHADLNKNDFEVNVSSKRPPFESRDNVPPVSNATYKLKVETFILNDKQIANQVKDVLARMITLCQ